MKRAAYLLRHILLLQALDRKVRHGPIGIHELALVHCPECALYRHSIARCRLQVQWQRLTHVMYTGTGRIFGTCLPLALKLIPGTQPPALRAQTGVAECRSQSKSYLLCTSSFSEFAIARPCQPD